MAKRLQVLIAGGGVGALEATLALQHLAERRVDVEVLAPDDEFVYRALSVAEPFRQGQVRRFPLGRLVEAAGGRYTQGRLEAVDTEKKTVTTDAGTTRAWDVLVLALGADQQEAIPGAMTFRGPEDRQKLEEIVDEALTGKVRSIVFALPTLSAWPLPLYELALMTKLRLEDAGSTRVSVDFVTPEAAPLSVFGGRASSAMASLLATRGITVHDRTTPVAFRDGALVIVPGLAVRADRVVALPTPKGRALPGIPADAQGFVQTDEFGRVGGQADVYAVGDMTSFPLKQGGIATQQADAAAEAVAAAAGADLTPQPFRPVLRGLLLTGLTPRYMRSNPLDASSEVDSEPLWWPPGKIVGKYLSPFLAEHLGLSPEPPPEVAEAGVHVDVELVREHAGWAPTGT
jgi:sulfide:quinone oxidoreductase